MPIPKQLKKMFSTTYKRYNCKSCGEPVLMLFRDDKCKDCTSDLNIQETLRKVEKYRLMEERARIRKNKKLKTRQLA